MAYVDIADLAFAPGKPIKASLLKQLRDNQTAAAKPFLLAWDVTATNPGTSYGAAVYTGYVYVPEDCSILQLRCALWRSAGTGAVYAQAKASYSTATATSTEATSTSTAKTTPGGAADVTLTISGLDSVGGVDYRGREATITLYLRSAQATATVECEATAWPPHRARHA